MKTMKTFESFLGSKKPIEGSKKPQEQVWTIEGSKWVAQKFDDKIVIYKGEIPPRFSSRYIIERPNGDLILIINLDNEPIEKIKVPSVERALRYFKEIDDENHRKSQAQLDKYDRELTESKNQAKLEGGEDLHIPTKRIR